ncbi:MAG: mandelate racemase/muconate lactonizing enzyme family protein [Acidobacteriota bacterium]|jgi:L-alanine-DL-glutamate epimerase-like enolase superfamily enzyme
MDRRHALKGLGVGAGAVTAGLHGLATEADAEAVRGRVNTSSEPSQLKITDLRVVGVRRRWLIRIDTNQGLYGYGEVRDGGSPTSALMLKSRVVGENPLNVDKIFRKIKQFGYHARQSGGPVAIEEACWDIAGKAWGVPCWQMLGGQFRDKIRVYADTPSDPDPVKMGDKLKRRMERGFTFLKMDISINLLRDVEGGLTWPKGQGVDPWGQYSRSEFSHVEHPFTGIRITEKGLKVMADYTATVRDIVGWEIPIATDHYGHFGIEDGIKLARALDPFNLAWLEDMVPWFYTDQYVRLKNSCTTPILTGEDIWLKEGFMDLFEKKAIAICHPDLATSGGLLETKKIGDLAQEHGIAMALHMAGHPVTLFSSVHCAAATENFLVMEHHNVDDAWYDDLVSGVPKPIMDNEGFIPVPSGPGLGIELNEDAVKGMLEDPEKEYFAPTPEWDDERAWDRLWSRTGPTEKKAQPA